MAWEDEPVCNAASLGVDLGAIAVTRAGARTWRATAALRSSSTNRTAASTAIFSIQPMRPSWHRPDWMRRFDKVHAQAARSLPKPQSDTARRWRELDSSMSSDALLMNVFCTPGVAESPAGPGHARRRRGCSANLWRRPISVEGSRSACQRPLRPHRGRSALRLAARRGKVDRSRTSNRAPRQSSKSYRDFDEVFDRDRLPRAEIATTRWMRASEFPENASQELESLVGDPALFPASNPASAHPAKRAMPAIS